MNRVTAIISALVICIVVCLSWGVNHYRDNAIAYSTSAGSAGYWFLQLLDRVTPSQWAAIGVLGSLVFGLLTYLTNLYFKIKEDKRKAARGE